MKEHKHSKDLEKIREMIKEELKSNSVSLGGVEVASTCESLKNCQEVAQKLLDRNKDFLLAKSKLKSTTNYVG